MRLIGGASQVSPGGQPSGAGLISALRTCAHRPSYTGVPGFPLRRRAGGLSRSYPVTARAPTPSFRPRAPGADSRVDRMTTPSNFPPARAERTLPDARRPRRTEVPGAACSRGNPSTAFGPGPPSSDGNRRDRRPPAAPRAPDVRAARAHARTRRPRTGRRGAPAGRTGSNAVTVGCGRPALP